MCLSWIYQMDDWITFWQLRCCGTGSCVSWPPYVGWSVIFPPINRTVCTSVFFFTEKCALCWIAHQLFQTRNVKVLKLPVVLKTDVLFSLTCCGHRARCFTNSPLLEYKLEASEVIVEVSVRSSAEIETTLKKIWIPSKAIFPYSS